MTDNQKKLMNILREMFQFDQADLDFGIYRIMRMKRVEISRFIDEELPAQISEGLSELARLDTAAEITAIDKQIADTKTAHLSEAIKAAAVAELEENKKAIAESVNVAAVEADVYNHLTNFFSRYYDDGDFISQRRYKDGAYSIPYEGEEVKLHWTNADQYYVKTSEYFKDYTFKTMYGNTIRFKLVEADTEQDNNKANEKRYFQLHTEKPFEVINSVLYIYVEYKNGGKKNQAECTAEIVSAFIEVQTQKQYQPFSSILSITDKKMLLERQLNRYTARNTFDYFIHKDLGKFLRRELDFYIKNDVIFLDDIDEQDEVKTKEYLTKAKVIRKIALKLIAFLAQIEDFQKKLYLKKKFVVETNYCITLDRVPETLYPEIAANESQRQEWVRLFAIDEIEAKDGDLVNAARLAYSVPLSVDFLKQNPSLVMDTAFFSAEFKERLVDSIGSDDKLDGLMIHSENSQALRLLSTVYKEKIRCAYIDPPYNTENDTFPYKDGYKNSSWLSMIADRVALANCLLNSDNSTFLSNIDKNEMFIYKTVLDAVLPNKSFVNAIVNVNNPKGRSDQKHLPTAHDNIMFYASDGFVSYGWQPAQKVLKRYSKTDINNEKYREIDLRKTGDADRRIDRENMFYYFHYNESTGDLYPTTDELPPTGYISIRPMKDDTVEGRWRWELDTSKINMFKLIAKFMPNKKRWSVFELDYLLEDERVFPTSVWDEKPFNSERGTETFISMGFDKELFKNPKPVGLMKYLFEHTTRGNDIILDFFLGSGTTVQGVIEQNAIDKAHRTYIAIEMGEYFDTIAKPRVEKAVYCIDWKDGKPVSRQGISHTFKYLRLESYEDALNNIVLRSDEYDMFAAVREGYMLSYMIGTEAAGSASLLNVEKLDKPFSYKMDITRNLESSERTIDLVETFNYLIGLTVVKSHALVSYDADFVRGEYGAVSATLKAGDTYKFKAVEGTVPSGDKALVLWREMTGDIEKDNASLDTFFLSLPNARSFKRVYVNCDNNLLNLRGSGESWQVVLIDEEMKKRMFEDTK